jgi:hypothetical protein
LGKHIPATLSRVRSAQGTIPYWHGKRPDRIISIHVVGSSFPSWNGANQKCICTVLGRRVSLLRAFARDLAQMIDVYGCGGARDVHFGPNAVRPLIERRNATDDAITPMTAVWMKLRSLRCYAKPPLKKIAQSTCVAALMSPFAARERDSDDAQRH